ASGTGRSGRRCAGTWGCRGSAGSASTGPRWRSPGRSRTSHRSELASGTVTEILLSATGLTKPFGDFTAVDGIDVQVTKGESFGFLGPNGAGKSSTMKMVAATSPPGGGGLRIFGLDPVPVGAAVRARLGSVPQQDHLDEEIAVEEILHVYGRYFGLPRKVIRERTEQLLGLAQLTGRRKDMVEP